jgi:hypothetical protein
MALAKAKTGFARANNGRRRSSGPSAQFWNWRAAQNKAMNSYTIDIAL